MLCVTDANIWIDLANGELEEHVFQIGLELIIPNLVLVELRNPPSSRLKSIGLQPVNLSGDQLDELVGSLARRYPGPSRVDLSALLVARDEGLTLLTGDRALRRAAEAEGVAVHGILWILDRILDYSMLKPAEAASCLRHIVEAGARLPAAEVTKRLHLWDPDDSSIE